MLCHLDDFYLREREREREREMIEAALFYWDCMWRERESAGWSRMTSARPQAWLSLIKIEDLCDEAYLPYIWRDLPD